VPAWLDVGIFGLTLFFILVGLVGLIVPIFPGIVVIWLATLFYGIVIGFNTVGIIIFVILTLLMLAGTMIDNFLMAAGSRTGGASWWTIGAGLLAGTIGTIVFPPFGGLIAAPLVILLIEFLRVREINQAWRATGGLVVGWGMSFFVRLGIGVVMLLLWLLWAFVK
jgi:uncharacterized protein YqgC (DUF456 family)